MTEAQAPGAPRVAAAPPASKPLLAVEVLCALLLAFLLLLLLGGAVLRHQGYTAPAVYEFVRVLFVYLVALSAVIAYAHRTNLCVPGWWREDTVSYQAAMSVLSLGLTGLTVQMLLKQGFRPDASSLLGVPEGISHIPIGLFAIGLSLISLKRLLAAWRGALA